MALELSPVDLLIEAAEVPEVAAEVEIGVKKQKRDPKPAKKNIKKARSLTLPPCKFLF